MAVAKALRVLAKAGFASDPGEEALVPYAVIRLLSVKGTDGSLTSDAADVLAQVETVFGLESPVYKQTAAYLTQLESKP